MFFSCQKYLLMTKIAPNEKKTDIWFCFYHIFSSDFHPTSHKNLCQDPSTMKYNLPFDSHHQKSNLKVFVVVISKEGLAGWAPPILLWVPSPPILLWVWHGHKLLKAAELHFIVGVIPKERLAGHSFFLYDNDKAHLSCVPQKHVLKPNKRGTHAVTNPR